MSEDGVMALLADGQRLGRADQIQEAKAAYLQAWELAGDDDYLCCTVAHMLGVLEPDPSEKLSWNVEALRRADAVHDERVRGFYPSLYANLGHSYMLLDESDQAREAYLEAEKHLPSLPEGDYGQRVRAEVLARVKDLRDAEPEPESRGSG